MHTNKNKGFSLIELLVVVLIIGILAAIALPQYQKVVLVAETSEAVTLARKIAEAEIRYKLATGSCSGDISKLDISFDGKLIISKYSVPSIQTDRFLCRASACGQHSSLWADVISSCNRLPYTSKYAINVLNNGSIDCRYYNDEGQKACTAAKLALMTSSTSRG